MLSTSNLEKLIALKKREIEKEKSVLGLAACANLDNDKENESTNTKLCKVNFSAEIDSSDHNDTQNKEETHRATEDIPPDLERYIRRYLGLPVMLKAGEYSPNNPLVKAERQADDVMLGLGEYERRRNTLRKIRQQQYKEYLDEQAQKKQEAKQQAERERREREEKEKQREVKEREILLERDRCSPRRSSVPVSVGMSTSVDTGIQVNGFTQPLSVAVQTDDSELYRQVQCGTSLTQAERELSPRGATDVRRRSHGDYDRLLVQSNRDKLTSELRHTYMPSIFDSEAIRLRNVQAEKEAAERRQFYQQELKNQILEQQRIKEERKSREKMLEQAEMRRLEEQLRMLRLAQDREVEKQHELNVTMTHSSSDYEIKRKNLQTEIDTEKHKYIRAISQPINKKTYKSDTMSQLQYYPKKKPYSMNIPDNSIFSANYDVDSYLRRNLNFNKEKTHFNEDGYHDSIRNEKTKEKTRFGIEKSDNSNLYNKEKYSNTHNKDSNRSQPTENIRSPTNKLQNRHEIIEDEEPYTNKNILIEKALIHRTDSDVDSLPIPVLRHSPKINNIEENSPLSEAMKKVDDKWKVPAVQKNILKALPTQEGKSVNILTQLGSIRRQLQLEQLKLDSMIKKDE